MCLCLENTPAYFLHIAVNRPLHENEFVRKLPENIRLGYTLAKAVRITAISEPSDLSGLTLDEEEKINSEDVITTYMLKTCLMTLYEEHKKNRSKMKAKQVIWTKMIYERLREFIHNGELKTYYGDGVLFQCGDHPDDDTLDRACCHKRELILRMCDAMLSWLRANRAELEELQELYPELRLEVYNRTSLHRD